MADVQRKNQTLLAWARAIIVGGLTGGALVAMHVTPAWLAPSIGVAVAVLALANTELAVLLAVIAMCAPVIAVQPVVGLAMLVVLIASLRFLGGDGARAYIVLGASIAGAFFGPAWAAAVIAGFVFGPLEGAIVAAIACVGVEAVGIVLGKTTIGVVVAGGPARAIVSFAHVPELLSGTWVPRAFTAINIAAIQRVTGAIGHLDSPAMLLAQPALWAAGAAVAGLIAQQARRTKRSWFGLVAVALGVAVPAAGGAVVGRIVGSGVEAGPLAIAFAESLIVAAIFAIVWERVFPLQRATRAVPEGKVATMATEDADVDELLRLIATAEDKLATQHTTSRVVMITDMKSFSSMTEEDGSVASAKAIQRHRDLLVPVIQRHRGAGKSTGGDGLVAAFDSADEAVLAAVDMQKALAAHNSAHPDERAIMVRIGIAQGEVVLDNGGRPFIGTALNVAARVMNLADGGQVFATDDVASSPPGAAVPCHSFGPFSLKNIAKPVEIVEVLWADAQVARDPRDSNPEASPS